jgi:hypothetical protein
MRHGVVNSIVKRTGNYSVLRIQSYEKTPYIIHTLIDTKYEKYVDMFNWNRHSTLKYITAEISDSAYNNCIVPLDLPLKNGGKILFHRFIMLMSKTPNPENYVDHIDRQTFDNREKNLRWASQALQNQNTDKRKRKTGAQDLPNDIGLTEGQKLPKYVVWYCDHEESSSSTEDKKVILERRYFKIEKHPALTKPWISTKKSKISNIEKFNLTLTKLAELDKIVNSDPDAELRASLVNEYNGVMKEYLPLVGG